MFITRIGILLIFICTGWVCKEYSTGCEWAYERRESFHTGGVYWNYIRYNSTLVACIGISSVKIPPWWRVLELHQVQFHPGGVYWNYIRYNSTLVACIGIPSDTIPPWWPVLELHQVQFHPCGVYWNYIRYNSNLVACIGITSDSTLVAGIRITTGKIPPCGVYRNYIRYNSTLVACFGITPGTIPHVEPTIPF